MPTALVTGATAGLGDEFARQLAARGDAVVLVARTETRLREVAAELEAAHSVTTELLVADLADPADVDRVAERASTTDMVVNNAGFGLRQRFLDSDAAQREDPCGKECTASPTGTTTSGWSSDASCTASRPLSAAGPARSSSG